MDAVALTNDPETIGPDEHALVCLTLPELAYLIDLCGDGLRAAEITDDGDRMNRLRHLFKDLRFAELNPQIAPDFVLRRSRDGL